jgi:hypothetical protein
MKVKKLAMYEFLYLPFYGCYASDFSISLTHAKRLISHRAKWKLSLPYQTFQITITLTRQH